MYEVYKSKAKAKYVHSIICLYNMVVGTTTYTHNHSCTLIVSIFIQYSFNTAHRDRVIKPV